MKTIIQIPQNPYAHINQIITGFYMLFGSDVEIRTSEAISSRSHVLANCNGVNILYDLDDGYQNIDAIREDIKICDFYFKRSFSTHRNKEFGLDIFGSKLLPLGFNYNVILQEKWYGQYFSIRQKLRNSLCAILPHCISRMLYVDLPENIEMQPSFKLNSGKPKILFATRLWVGAENRGINQMRIDIIRALKDKYGKAFYGGLEDSILARQLAPDLILNKAFTKKRSYLKRMRNSDICIASTGLHNSIGWKFAEYIVASKAICSERLCYEVPDGFNKNKNYIEFNSVDSCVDSVDYLVHHPEKIREMQNANREYYINFLKPDILVANTLDLCKLL